jgi:hypothetical protein
MSKIIKAIQLFLLLTLIANTTFATVSCEGKELKDITHSALKLGIKEKEQLADLAKFSSRILDNIGAVGNLNQSSL